MMGWWFVVDGLGMVHRGWVVVTDGVSVMFPSDLVLDFVFHSVADSHLIKDS